MATPPTATASDPATTAVKPARQRRPAVASVADGMAAKVAAILAEKSTASVEDVAAAVGRAPRTARRYVAAARAATVAV